MSVRNQHSRKQRNYLAFQLENGKLITLHLGSGFGERKSLYSLKGKILRGTSRLDLNKYSSFIIDTNDNGTYTVKPL